MEKPQVSDLRASRTGRAFFKSVFPNYLWDPSQKMGCREEYDLSTVIRPK